MDKKVILIVEDDIYLKQVLLTKLKGEGFGVLEAANGEEGLEVIKNHHIDLILLDIIMPVMDGITMLKKVRELEANQNPPVIILTNLMDAPKKAEALQAGVFDYLVKTDWKLDDLVDLIKKRM